MASTTSLRFACFKISHLIINLPISESRRGSKLALTAAAWEWGGKTETGITAHQQRQDLRVHSMAAGFQTDRLKRDGIPGTTNSPPA